MKLFLTREFWEKLSVTPNYEGRVNMMLPVTQVSRTSAANPSQQRRDDHNEVSLLKQRQVVIVIVVANNLIIMSLHQKAAIEYTVAAVISMKFATIVNIVVIPVLRTSK